jgi:hypothetical protein
MPELCPRVTAEAAAVDAAAQPAAPAAAAPLPDAPKPVDPLTEARGVIGFICISACAVFPCLAPIYTAEKREQLAQVTAPLLEQYGVDLGVIMGKYGNWINFAMVAFPLGTQTFRVMKAQADKIKEKNFNSAAPDQPQAVHPAAANDPA